MTVLPIANILYGPILSTLKRVKSLYAAHLLKNYQLGPKRMPVVQTTLTTGWLFTERRGKHGNQWNKNLCSKILPRMTEHLGMLLATESHYTRY